RLIRLHASHRI
ncbi:oligopeptidase A, partial [Vibrio parahaemolyticus EKP-028]